MKTTAQIMHMDERSLRHFVARLQVEVAQHERRWAGGCSLDEMYACDLEVDHANRIKREVYAQTKAETSLKKS